MTNESEISLQAGLRVKQHLGLFLLEEQQNIELYRIKWQNQLQCFARPGL